ncbi:MAG TPA: YlxR family protein [Candidatus Binatus sp.]|nr:YlxR family protein [Candidatus Binatus sp.]
MRRHEPIRTCTGCGARAPQHALVRFVAAAGALRLDEHREAPGRGAYLHRSAGCWTAFARRRGPVRSLRMTPARPERERLVAMLAIDAAAKVEG